MIIIEQLEGQLRPFERVSLLLSKQNQPVANQVVAELLQLAAFFKSPDDEYCEAIQMFRSMVQRDSYSLI